MRSTAIHGDQEGVLWIGTDDGVLNRFDSENEQWIHYGNDPSDSHNLGHDSITTISEEQSGMIWIGTGGGGLDRFDPENENVTHYQHDPDDPKSLSSDKSKRLFKIKMA